MTHYQIQWSQRASSDLRKIKAFISYDKPLAAMQWLKKAKSKTERLKRFPYSGRVVPELLRKDIREIIFGHYRIIYKITPKVIFILTVFEAHQQFPFNKVP